MALHSSACHSFQAFAQLPTRISIRSPSSFSRSITFPTHRQNVHPPAPPARSPQPCHHLIRPPPPPRQAPLAPGQPRTNRRPHRRSSRHADLLNRHPKSHNPHKHLPLLRPRRDPRLRRLLHAHHAHPPGNLDGAHLLHADSHSFLRG